MFSSVIEHPRPVGQGAFLLPDLDSAIPAQLNGKAAQEILLARLVLASERAGVPLPGGQFVGVKETLKLQWASYAQATLKAGSCIQATIEFIVQDTLLEVRVVPAWRLPLIRIKSMVERLESIRPGLGWFAWDVVIQASCHGVNFYETSMLPYQLLRGYEDSEGDEGFAKSLLEEESRVSVDGPVSPEEMARLRREYEQPWPSDLLHAVGGHANMLGWKSANKALEASVVSECAQSGGSSWAAEELQCINDALALHVALANDVNRAFLWDQCDPNFDSFGENPELVGAAAFIVWDESSMLEEAVSEFEQCAQSGSNAIEAIGHCYVLNTASDAELGQLVHETVNYLKRWKLIEALLRNFEIEEYEHDEI